MGNLGVLPSTVLRKNSLELAIIIRQQSALSPNNKVSENKNGPIIVFRGATN